MKFNIFILIISFVLVLGCFESKTEPAWEIQVENGNWTVASPSSSKVTIDGAGRIKSWHSNSEGSYIEDWSAEISPEEIKKLKAYMEEIDVDEARSTDVSSGCAGGSATVVKYIENEKTVNEFSYLHGCGATPEGTMAEMFGYVDSLEEKYAVQK